MLAHAFLTVVRADEHARHSRPDELIPLTSNPELLISPAPDTATTGIDEFVDIPDRHRSRYTTLLVSDGSDDGFVVCGSLRVHEN